MVIVGLPEVLFENFDLFRNDRNQRLQRPALRLVLQLIPPRELLRRQRSNRQQVVQFLLFDWVQPCPGRGRQLRVADAVDRRQKLVNLL